MKKLFFLISVIILTSCGSRNRYETVPGDEMQTRICTLDNGLKIYMSVNRLTPDVTAHIAVHAGSTYEPETNTGLAHYLEHLMFKGTDKSGTTDYKKEKPLLDKITALYGVYGKTTDAADRKKVYHQIDSVSQLASKYFIPNEYDKMMATIGSNVTNAYTYYDQTVYVETVPSNRLEDWAKVQSDRFKHMVIRGFHTELEAVYEEYNIHLNNDADEISGIVSGTLFPNHPYKRSVIGLGKHLKNPSITEIERFFHTYYVPNNVAICLSGDFNPDEMVKIIQKYFGDWKRNDTLRRPHYDSTPARLSKPVIREVVSPNPEMLEMAWAGVGGNASLACDTLELVSQILCNGRAGLMDIDLNKRQKVVGAGCFTDIRRDISTLRVIAYPKPGQNFDEMRRLVLSEMQKLRKGQFSEDLLQGIVTQMKWERENNLPDNEERVDEFVTSFVYDVPWEQCVGKMERLKKISKQDVVNFARRHFTDNNYVAVYKKVGEKPNVETIEKPDITPIESNREAVSPFVKEIMSSKVKPIDPVFVDFTNDLTKSTVCSLPMLYTHNDVNDIFSLSFTVEHGIITDRRLNIAAEYLDLLGTKALSADEIAHQFYLLGCDFSLSSGNRTTTLTLGGLSENMEPALKLLEKLMRGCQTDRKAFTLMIQNDLKARQMSLQDFDSYSGALGTYMYYGPEGDKSYTNDELTRLDASSIVDCLHGILKYHHRIDYNGPMDIDQVKEILQRCHGQKKYLKSPHFIAPCPQITTTDECIVMPYKGTKTFTMSQYSCDGKTYDCKEAGVIDMYNEYMNGSMNSIDFQELREKRSLCYGASSRYIEPSFKKGDYYIFTKYIQAQNDKLDNCITVFDDIINNMPTSKSAFKYAKEALITRMRAQRTPSWGIIGSYIASRYLGLDEDINKILFEQVQNLTLDDVITFQKKHVKNRHYHTGIAGDPSCLDQASLKKLGKVTIIEPSKVFGYTK